MLLMRDIAPTEAIEKEESQILTTVTHDVSDPIHTVIDKLYRCTISLRMGSSEAPLCAFFWSPIPNNLLFTALKVFD